MSTVQELTAQAAAALGRGLTSAEYIWIQQQVTAGVPTAQIIAAATPYIAATTAPGANEATLSQAVENAIAIDFSPPVTVGTSVAPLTIQAAAELTRPPEVSPVDAVPVAYNVQTVTMTPNTRTASPEQIAIAAASLPGNDAPAPISAPAPALGWVSVAALLALVAL